MVAACGALAFLLSLSSLVVSACFTNRPQVAGVELLHYRGQTQAHAVSTSAAARRCRGRDIIWCALLVCSLPGCLARLIQHDRMWSAPVECSLSLTSIEVKGLIVHEPPRHRMLRAVGHGAIQAGDSIACDAEREVETSVKSTDERDGAVVAATMAHGPGEVVRIHRRRQPGLHQSQPIP